MNTIKFDLIECWTINRFLNMKLTGLMKIVTLFYIMFLLMQQQSAIKLSATDVKEFHMTTNEGDINNNNKNNNNNSNNNNNTNNNKNKQMALNSTNINYCLVKMNNATILKELNSKWTQEDDPCLIHYCELQAPAHKPLEIVIRKNCTNLYCDIHSEIRPKNNTCCGECVRTKCLYQDKFYEIGQKWYDDDNCILFECINNLNGNSMTPEVNSYRKYCSPLPANCAVELIYTHDCCQYCNQIVNNTINTNSNNNSNNIKIGKINSSIDNKQINHFVYATLNNNDIWTQEFYRQHLCVRECHENEPAKICEYTFVVEWYETLSNACYNCPHNISDCQRPHCVAGDGIRRAITVVNRMMPGPEIQVCQNDIVVVNVRNNLLGDSTTIHWHGMHMKENPYMDGVPHITQCPISPHATFRYIFRAKNSGTHFWHSHTGMQRGDGVFGAFIVKKPRTQDPHRHLYDFDLIEHKMTLQDWIHVPGVSLFTAHHHSQGDNKPINLLINGKGRYYPAIWQEIKKTESFKNARQSSNQTNANYTVLTPPITLNLSRNKSYKTPVQDNEVLRQKFENKSKLIIKRATMDFKNLSALPLETFHVHSGYRYRFRIINAEFLNCPIQVSIDNHTLLAINSDGYDLEAADIGSIVTYAGERFDFILNANQIAGNYWIRLKGLMDCDERFTSAFQVAILHYIEVDLQEPSLSLHYDHQPEGITLNALNRGSGHVDSLTIAEINSLPINDHLFGVERKILKSLPDYKFFIYYDFYGKDNPTFHPSEYYSFNATLDKASRLLTPQLNHISFKVPSIALLPARDEIDENIFCNETSLKKAGVNCRQEFCQCLHVLQVPLNAIIELILVDEGFAYNANHPFHLHGTAFRVLAIEKLGENVTVEMVKELDRQNQLKRNLDQPPIKDTVTVPDGGYTIVRFEASNPGYWLLHCHIEFHAEIGMALVLKVGNNNDMPPIPKHFPSCYDYDPLENDTLDNNSNAIQNSKGINKSHSLSTILQIILFIYLFKKILLTIFHVVNN